MDIRKYFSTTPTEQIASNKKKLKNFSLSKNGLCRERQLNLTPTKKQCKKYDTKQAKAMLLSSDESDGENPITGDLKKKLKLKKRQKIISSDEDDDHNFLSASTSKPLTNTSYNDNKKKNTLKKIPSLIESDDSHSKDGIGLQVKRRTARKIINVDEELMLEVFSKKRKASHKIRTSSEMEDENEKETRKTPKRPKRSDEAIVPMEIVSELFTNEKAKPKKKILKEKLKESPKKIEQPKENDVINKPKKEIRFEISPKKILNESLIKDDKNMSNTSKKDNKSVNKNIKKEIVETSNVLKKQKYIENLPWVEKYKPVQIKQLVGQHTDKSCLNKLIFWLRDWAKNNLYEDSSKKKPKVTGFQAQNDGTGFKAALLSGPPGIGKTSCAVLVCKELGLNYIETNASDARNKKSIEKNVAGLLDTQQINQFFSTSNPKIKGINQVLIMDEVDGMSGNQDRAGIAELILMIKRTKVPIICICNDRQSSKIRSLANYCFDLRFQKPRLEQIMGRLLTIVMQEHVNISKDCLQKIIEASNQDIRQCIHSLQLLSSSSNQSYEQFNKKNIAVNVFEAIRRLLSKESNLMEKQELFFSDYSIMPLFVQENYLNVRASQIGNAQHIRCIKQAAENIAFGDIIDKQIRSLGAWNLLVDEAMFSCALPALAMDGYLTQQIQFPTWFGKNSSTNKRQRLMRQLSVHTYHKISGNNCALVSDYIPVLRNRMYRPLIENESAGVKDVVEFYKAYNLIKDDAEAINELGIWPSANKNKKDISQCVSTKVKTALTKALNKANRLLPYAQSAPVKGRKRGSGKMGRLEIDEEGNEILIGAEDDEDDETAEEE